MPGSKKRQIFLTALFSVTWTDPNIGLTGDSYNSLGEMIISHQKRFVMFLPWKTASQTTVLRLQPYNESPYDLFFYFNNYLNRVVHQHLTCAEFACLPESKLGYFTVSFVRNPYDRVYSGFRQLQEDIQGQTHARYPEPWIRDHVITQLAENFAQLCRAQFKFDEWLNFVRDEQVYEIGRNTNFPLHPAHYWTHVAGKRCVDSLAVWRISRAIFRNLCHKLELIRCSPLMRMSLN
jgi:Sulfotransferase family